MNDLEWMRYTIRVLQIQLGRSMAIDKRDHPMDLEDAGKALELADQKLEKAIKNKRANNG